MKQLSNKQKILIAVIAGIICAVTSAVVNELVVKIYPNRAKPDDLFFEILPYIAWMQYVSDIALIFSMSILAVHLKRKKSYSFWLVLTSISIMLTIRALITILTPFQRPTGDEPYGLLRSFQQNTMFPSGHTANAFLAYLWINGKTDKVSKALTAILLIIQIASLLLSRGHYSIDIVGGLMLAFMVYELLLKYVLKINVYSRKKVQINPAQS